MNETPDEIQLYVLRYTVVDHNGRRWGFTHNNVTSWADGEVRDQWGRVIAHIDGSVTDAIATEVRRPVWHGLTAGS